MNKEELVLSWMDDEESRFIFEKRLSYNRTNDFSYIREIIEKYLPHLATRNYYPGKEQKLKELVFLGGINVLFGAGARLRRVCKIWKDDVLPFSFATDNNESLWNTDNNGITIIAPDSIDWEKVDKVVITTYRCNVVNAIRTQLLNYGVSEKKIIVFNDYVEYEDNDDEYFDEKIIKWKEDECFVDAGVLDLYTSIGFVNRCRKAGGNAEILAFEPDEVLYDRCKKKMDTNEFLKGDIYNTGLWSSDKILFFEVTHGGDGRIVDWETEKSVNVVKLDNYIDKPITFIKMDIEGAELEALKGSREVILKYKPKLAISVYHKPEDILEIPMYIKKLVPEYKLYMRHYSDSVIETVLYAVIE